MSKNLNCPKCGTDNYNNAKYCSGCGVQLPKTESQPSGNTEPRQTDSKTENKKKIISAVVGIIAFGLSFVAVQYFFFDYPSFDKTMMKVASEINESCPVMIDKDTRLDNTVVQVDNTFQYNYTLIHKEKSEIDIEGLKRYIEPILVNGVKSNPDMQIYRDHKTTMTYHYKDKNGVFLFKINVTPDQYE